MNLKSDVLMHADLLSGLPRRQHAGDGADGGSHAGAGGEALSRGLQGRNHEQRRECHQ